MPGLSVSLQQGGADKTLYSPNVFARVRRAGLAVLSGTDEGGRMHQCDRDLLTITANDFGTFEQHDGKRLERMLEALPPNNYDKAQATRRKSA